MTGTENSHIVQPYLFFDGRCEEAIEFYRRALGAALFRSTDAGESCRSFPDCAATARAKLAAGD